MSVSDSHFPAHAWQALADCSPCGIYQTDLAGRCVYINRALQELSGFSREESLGLGWVRAIHVDDRERVLTEARMAHGTDVEFDTTYRLQTPGGSVHHVRARSRPTRDMDGRPTGRVGAVVDITDLVEAQANVRAGNARLEAILARVPSGISVFDREARLVAGNTMFQALEHAIPQARQAAIAASDGATQFLESHFGDERIVEVRRTGMPDGGFVATYTDVTQRRDVGAGALTSRFLDLMIEEIPLPIFVKDAEHLRFVRVNRAFAELVGCSADEMVGRNDGDFFPPEEADFFIGKDREVLATGGSVDVEEPIHTRARGVRLLHTRKVGICDDEGRPRLLLGISEDITEKARRQQEVLRLNAQLEQRSAEAEAATRAKSAFLATMSHEIRTPMNGMLGLLELLSLTRLDTEQRVTLETIRESSRLLLRIVDDTLDFSKIEAGRLDIRPEACSVADIVKEIESAFSGAATGKGLVIASGADPRIAPRVLVDCVRLQQILSNFVSNAIKFTACGSVAIRAELESADSRTQHLRFLVIDTGPGVSAEDQRHLFQPFSQGNAVAARQAGGTGLGLTISRRLAELMGGSVEMQSAFGHGTTMVLRLSVQTDALGDADCAPWRDHIKGESVMLPLTGAREGNQATRVLVVDDHPTNRMLLLRQMQALGYAAESAAEGAEALSLWQSGRFAMVITDCEMPGMDGYEFSTELRRLEAASGRPRVPIIACTAHALAGVAEKCFGAGMDDVIIKPMNLDQLARKLQQWLVPHDGDAAAAGVDVTDAPLDLAVISQRWGGAAAVHEVLATFRRCNQEDAARLRDAAGMGDVAQVKAMSHRMAGAAGMVGASDLASSCRRVEQAAEAGDSQEIHAGLAVFAREWARVAQYCEAAPAHAGGNGGLRHRAAIAAGHSPAWRTMDRPRVYPGSDGQEHDAFCLR